MRNEYPRPQFRRDNWVTLNGIWDFAFADEIGFVDLENPKLNRQIEVPFSYQYPLSKVNIFEHHDTLWYKKEFEIASLDQGVLLCFNAVDYECDVYLNGKHIKHHVGGYTPFSVDISDFVKKKNVLVLKVFDPLDPENPRGKQSWINDRFGCWYIPNSGIWQSVWLEFFNKDLIDSYSIETDIDSYLVSGEIRTLYGLADKCKMTLKFKNKIVKEETISLDGKFTNYAIKLQELDFVDESFYWTPERPNLFYLDFCLLHEEEVLDIAYTRFGMKKISVDGMMICLNNRPYYQRLILDQGYFEESGITPPSVDALKEDIMLAKKMGYNGARKHQKFEDPYFYYLADELGFLTWCEMPSAYHFSAKEIENINRDWQEIVKVARNFTSVVCYVPLNESWGVRKILNDPNQQAFAKSLYYLTKALDGSKLVSINDGWENIEESDIITIHDYAFDSSKFSELYKPENIDGLNAVGRRLMALGNHYKNKPLVFSEFGGIAMVKDAKNGAWGYNQAAKNDEEFYARYKDLMEGVKKLPCYGFCYTQLTDVQQEVNGLLDEKHQPKFDIDMIFELTD